MTKVFIGMYRKSIKASDIFPIYEEYLSIDNDYVDLGSDITNIDVAKETLTGTERKYICEFVSISEIQANAAAAKSKGFSYIGYDLERGTGFTPDKELQDIPASVNKASDAAHQAGLGLYCAPAKDISENHAAEFAQYCNIIDMQGGGVIDTTAYETYYSTVAPKIKNANPNCIVIAQVSTIKGLTLDQIKSKFSNVAEYVDGATCWTDGEPDSLQQTKDFITWYKATY